MAITKRGLIVAFLVTGAIAALASSRDWREFRSSKGFSLMYPGDWFRQNISPDRLDILSSNGHWKAVVINKGEAQIFVVEESTSPRRTFAQVIEYYERGAKVLLRREISKDRRGACSHLEEVVSEEPSVPPEAVPESRRSRLTDFIYTGLFCQVKGRIIVLMLKNWEGDMMQKEYQEVALRMAESVRVPQ